MCSQPHKANVISSNILDFTDFMTQYMFTLSCCARQAQHIYTTKAIDNLILDDKNQEDIEDFKKFLNLKNWHFQYGIPYKRNYYLYGLLGTGKTSIQKY